MMSTPAEPPISQVGTRAFALASNMGAPTTWAVQLASRLQRLSFRADRLPMQMLMRLTRLSPTQEPRNRIRQATIAQAKQPGTIIRPQPTPRQPEAGQVARAQPTPRQPDSAQTAIPLRADLKVGADSIDALSYASGPAWLPVGIKQLAVDRDTAPDAPYSTPKMSPPERATRGSLPLQSIAMPFLAPVQQAEQGEPLTADQWAGQQSQASYLRTNDIQPADRLATQQSQTVTSPIAGFQRSFAPGFIQGIGIGSSTAALPTVASFAETAAAQIDPWPAYKPAALLAIQPAINQIRANMQQAKPLPPTLAAQRRPLGAAQQAALRDTDPQTVKLLPVLAGQPVLLQRAFRSPASSFSLGQIDLADLSRNTQLLLQPATTDRAAANQEVTDDASWFSARSYVTRSLPDQVPSRSIGAYEPNRAEQAGVGSPPFVRPMVTTMWAQRNTPWPNESMSANVTPASSAYTALQRTIGQGALASGLAEHMGQGAAQFSARQSVRSEFRTLLTLSGEPTASIASTSSGLAVRRPLQMQHTSFSEQPTATQSIADLPAGPPSFERRELLTKPLAQPSLQAKQTAQPQPAEPQWLFSTPPATPQPLLQPMSLQRFTTPATANPEPSPMESSVEAPPPAHNQAVPKGQMNERELDELVQHIYERLRRRLRIDIERRGPR